MRGGIFGFQIPRPSATSFKKGGIFVLDRKAERVYNSKWRCEKHMFDKKMNIIAIFLTIFTLFAVPASAVDRRKPTADESLLKLFEQKIQIDGAIQGEVKDRKAALEAAQKRINQEIDKVAALERKLDGLKPDCCVSPAKASPKKGKVKSAMELECESFDNPQKKADCYTAQSNEAAEKAAKAGRQAMALEPKTMRKVEEKRAELARRVAGYNRDVWKAIRNAEVTGCPVGSVWVNPVTLSKGPLDRIYHALKPPRSNMTITNNDKIAVDIFWTAGGEGRVVENLCPGGKLWLRQYVGPGGGFTRVSYMATATEGNWGGFEVTPNLHPVLRGFRLPNRVL